MRTGHRTLVLGLVIAVLGLAGCATDAPGSTPDIDASPTPTTNTPDPPATTAATTEPVPSENLGPFSCDLPVVEGATVAVANIVDVRIGEHAGYDRVVFEFQQGTPELTLDRASPPFTRDASGLPLDVEGESFLGITMRGGTKQTDAGESSYDGPTEFDPGFTTLVDLVEGGDFERQSTWYLGLTSEACARVLLLDDPPRVVIDVEH